MDRHLYTETQCLKHILLPYSAYNGGPVCLTDVIRSTKAVYLNVSVFGFQCSMYILKAQDHLVGQP